MRRLPLVAAALTPLLAVPALAAPTCVDEPRALCGGRVVAEAEQSVTFLQFDTPTESIQATLEAIEALAPERLEVMTLAEATGDPTHVSAGGRPVWVVRVTDESVPRDAKRQVAVSLSVHGLEAAGREGGVRYVEDLARWDGDQLLYAGDTARTLAETLAATETWIGFTNSDGWAAGDLLGTEGPGFQRGNATGADLNRDYATVGWYDRTGGRGIAESEPETRGWAALVRSLPRLTTSTDIHGELTTPNDAFSDLIIPAGQWSPRRQEQVDQLSRDMIRTVERKFAEEGVVLADVLGPLPADGATPRRAANVAAAYDIVGYDDSGFMGDWFSQTQDSVHMDVENFLSNLAPNNGFVPLIEQAHVAAVRGNIEATIVTAMITDQVVPTADYGRVAYVDDPRRVSSDPAVADGVPGTGAPVVEGETQVPYDVSRLDYFPELAAAYDAVVDPVDVLTTDLTSYDTLVVTDLDAPPLPGVDPAAWTAALRGFAEDGGQLLLTDRSLRLLDDLGLVPAEALTLDRTDAGHVDFVGPIGDHPFEEGLVGAPSQTYYEVMLGFPGRFSAPNFGIERGAWEAAGGTTVATVGPQDGDSPNTALGTVPLGEGSVTVLGALLPQPVEQLVLEDGSVTETPHPFGLASYAPTIAGGQVLDNVLSFRKAGAGVPVASPGGAPVAVPGGAAAPVAAPAGAPTAAPSGTRVGSLPATGAPVAVAVAGLVLLAGGAVVRGRAD